MNDVLEKILSGALTIGLFCWVWIRSQNRADKLEERVLGIEQDRMTRDEFKEMHSENQECLREIRTQIVENESKRSTTEHAILNVVNELKLKQAASEAVEKYKNTRT